MKISQKTHLFPLERHAGISRQALLILIIAIIAIGAASYFFFWRPAPPTAEPVAPPTSKQARPDSAREIISELKVTSPVDYAKAYEEAGNFREEGQLADAQLLYFFAARGGNGPAALELAAMYDPVNFDPGISLMDEPDMFQAYKWYRSALQAGEAVATQRLEALKTWAEQAAAQGDPKADQLLLQWEQ